MKAFMKTVVQVALFIGFAHLCKLIVHWLHLPIPGSIAGIIVIFTLLKLKLIRLDWIERGSRWLLSEMLLFFIPSAVAILNYKSLVIHDGLKITAIILSSTVTVMICSGLLGQFIAKRKEREFQ